MLLSDLRLFEVHVVLCTMCILKIPPSTFFLFFSEIYKIASLSVLAEYSLIEKFGKGSLFLSIVNQCIRLITVISLASFLGLFMQKKLPLVFIKGQSTDMTKLVSHRQCHLCGLFVGLNELAFLE